MRPSDIRKRLLKQRGVELKKHSRKPILITDVPVPFKKSSLMQLIEFQFKATIESLIEKGTIYELEKRLGVDATTISKWRKLIAEARGKEYFEQFEK
jgi:hypothetical protein